MAKQTSKVCIQDSCVILSMKVHTHHFIQQRNLFQRDPSNQIVTFTAAVEVRRFSFQILPVLEKLVKRTSRRQMGKWTHSESSQLQMKNGFLS